MDEADPRDTKYAELQAELHRVISKALAEHQETANYLMRFVVIAEVVESEGGRSLFQISADGMMAWDTLGLIRHAEVCESASLASYYNKKEE